MVRVVSSNLGRESECHNASTVSVLCVESHGVRSGYGRGSCGSQSHATRREGPSHRKGPDDILDPDWKRHFVTNCQRNCCSGLFLNIFLQII